MTPTRPYTTLVIGWGNELRGDDAVGVRVAEAVGRWGLDRVAVLTVRQLLPELAHEVADATCVVFVDAAVDGACVKVERVTVGQAPCGTHRLDPAALLSLTRDVFGKSPAAWLVSIPIRSFEVADEMSDLARGQMAEALERIRTLLEGLRSEIS